MEWVEKTARTVEEASELALDELGVSADDAEIEVLEDSKAGLFGRVRREARVRARVRPTQPRAKNERRDRRRRKPTGGGNAAKTPSEVVSGQSSSDGQPAAASTKRKRSRGTASGGRAATRPDGRQAKESNTDEGEPMIPLTLDEQADRMAAFLEGLVDAFGYDAGVDQTRINDETIELAVEGDDDLGLLIGPKGQTLAAVQELARVASTRDAGFPTEGRVRVDVGGYRQRRSEALERFTRKVAEEVIASGRQKVLEPMSPPDRKVVHDTANSIDGVRTFSEGEDSARRVIVAPA